MARRDMEDLWITSAIDQHSTLTIACLSEGSLLASLFFPATQSVCICTGVHRRKHSVGKHPGWDCLGFSEGAQRCGKEMMDIY